MKEQDKGQAMRQYFEEEAGKSEQEGWGLLQDIAGQVKDLAGELETIVWTDNLNLAEAIARVQSKVSWMVANLPIPEAIRIESLGRDYRAQAQACQ